MATDLLRATRKLLNECPATLPKVAAESGIGYEWLKKFASGAIENPGVVTVQQLHDFLESRRDKWRAA